MGRIYEMAPCGCNHSFICFQHRLAGRKPIEISDEIMAENDNIEVKELPEGVTDE